MAGGVPEEDAFAANRGGEVFAKGSAQDRGAGLEGEVAHRGIIALGSNDFLKGRGSGCALKLSEINRAARERTTMEG